MWLCERGDLSEAGMREKGRPSEVKGSKGAENENVRERM